jgi:beta-N-acetylhexosaminidase
MLLALVGTACSAGGDAESGDEPRPPAASDDSTADDRTHSAPTESTAPSSPGAPSKATEFADGATETSGTEAVSPAVAFVQRRVERMSVRDKARQLLVLPFSGTVAPESVIRRFHPGGLIYFSENLVDSDQIRALSQQSQRAAGAVGEPLLLMTDQEGGIVTRVPGTSDTPAGIEFGGDAAWARTTARDTGEMLASLGINVDLAPVADVNTVGDAGVIGPRSFGSDPDVVSRLTAAQVCGYHRGGVAAAVKHFPGHGSTTTDSHLEVVTIDRTLREWQEIDRPPFVAANRAGVDLVLVGHLSVPALDPSGRPATLSASILKGQLRRSIGFDRVIITDSMIMEGITAYGDSGTLAVRAVEAGVDLVLMPADPAGAVDGLVRAVRSGRIPEARLDASVERVLTLKQTLGLYRQAKSLPGC